MKRKRSGSISSAFKKLKISKKGTNKLPKIKTKGGKPRYGVTRAINHVMTAKEKKLLGHK
jgi:hypothetical protein